MSGAACVRGRRPASIPDGLAGRWPPGVAATLLESVGEDGLSDPYRVRNGGGSDSRGRRCFVTNFIMTYYVTQYSPRQPLDLCGDACVIGDGLSEMRLLSVGDDVGDGEERCGADRNERSR